MSKRHLSSNDGASSGASNKSKVMKRWWKENRKSHANALSEKEKLVKLLEVERQRAAALREENLQLQKALSTSTNHCEEFQAQLCHVMKELLIAKTEVLKARGMPPMIKKESERTSMLQMIGDAILFIFSVVMFKTKPLTRLLSLCEVIFDREIFGSFATQRVIKDISRKYARSHIFVLWKVLRSIDLTINGGINLTGLESLRKVEDLEEYQQGFLPS
jgi:hypothetical protein